MKKIVKRLFLLVAIACVIVLGVIVAGIYLARTEPAFYHSVALSADQLEAAAQSATDKFASIQNRVARFTAANHAAEHAASHGGTLPATAMTNAGPPILITFSADELNAFFDKWSTFNNWKSVYASYISDPQIILQDGRLILAAKSNDLDMLVSLHFEPSIDANGQLHLELVRILGGRLPLPKMLIEKYETRATEALGKRLPKWQHEAAYNSDGAANSNLIAASSALLLFHTLRDEPAEPVLFLPVVGQRGSVPVQITAVQITDGKLALTVVPMDHAQRIAMLDRIAKANVDGPRSADLSSR